MVAELNWVPTKPLLAIAKKLNGGKCMFFHILWYFLKAEMKMKSCSEINVGMVDQNSNNLDKVYTSYFIFLLKRGKVYYLEFSVCTPLKLQSTKCLRNTSHFGNFCLHSGSLCLYEIVLQNTWHWKQKNGNKYTLFRRDFSLWLLRVT